MWESPQQIITALLGRVTFHSLLEKTPSYLRDVVHRETRPVLIWDDNDYLSRHEAILLFLNWSAQRSFVVASKSPNLTKKMMSTVQSGLNEETFRPDPSLSWLEISESLKKSLLYLKRKPFHWRPALQCAFHQQLRPQQSRSHRPPEVTHTQVTTRSNHVILADFI